MRRLLTTSGMLLSGAVTAISGVAGAGQPDDETGSTAALAHFLGLADDYGYTVVDPVCSPTPPAGSDLTHTCYAMTTTGEPLIARTTLSPSDVVEFNILAAPGRAAVEADERDAPPFDALAYFDTLFSGDPARIASLKSVTAPGSSAEAYALYQHQWSESIVETDGTPDPAHVYLSADGVIVCLEPSSCLDVSNLEVVDGRLTDFAFGGYEIAARLGRPGQPIPVGSATVQARAAYRPITGGGSMRVYLEIVSTEPAMFELSKALYIDADGVPTPIDRELSVGADDVTVKGTATAALNFFDVLPGGEVRLVIYPEDGSAPLAAVIPIRSFDQPADDAEPEAPGE